VDTGALLYFLLCLEFYVSVRCGYRHESLLFFKVKIVSVNFLLDLNSKYIFIVGGREGRISCGFEHPALRMPVTTLEYSLPSDMYSYFSVSLKSVYSDGCVGGECWSLEADYECRSLGLINALC
jgi:hypothetical protein